MCSYETGHVSLTRSQSFVASMLRAGISRVFTASPVFLEIFARLAAESTPRCTYARPLSKFSCRVMPYRDMRSHVRSPRKLTHACLSAREGGIISKEKVKAANRVLPVPSTATSQRDQDSLPVLRLLLKAPRARTRYKYTEEVPCTSCGTEADGISLANYPEDVLYYGISLLSFHVQWCELWCPRNDTDLEKLMGTAACYLGTSTELLGQYTYTMYSSCVVIDENRGTLPRTFFFVNETHICGVSSTVSVKQ